MVYQVYKEEVERKVHLVPLVMLVHPVCLDCRVCVDLEEHKDKLVHPDLLVRAVSKVCLVLLVHQVQV